MKLKLKLNKNKSEININSSRQLNPKKIISSKKNPITIKTSNENSKTLTYANSKRDIENNSISNINKNDSSFINGNKFMNIDNIDESCHNQELFIIPTKQKKKYYTSNLDKAVETYNKIKQEINKKLYNKKVFNNIKSVQIQNYSMVNLLEKLNNVLDTIVERTRYNSNKIKLGSLSKSQEIIKSKEKENIDKRKITEKDNNNKMLNNYIQQYNLLSAKYEKLTNGNHVIKLKSNIANSSDEIIKLEKENRELKRTQSRTALILKHQKTSKIESNYKKKLEEYDKLSIEFDYIKTNINLKEKESQVNEKLIKNLEEKKNKLIKVANEKYNIQKPEEIIEKNKNDKEIEKIKLYIKRKELENQILIMNNKIKKYIIIENDNKKIIRELEENLSMKNLDLKLKKEEFVKLNEILEEVDMENNNSILQTDNIPIFKVNNISIFKTELRNINNEQNIINEKEKKIENQENQNLEKKVHNTKINKTLKKKGINQSHPEIKIKELNNRYSIRKEKNISQDNQIAKTYNKKMILQQLDEQKKREQDNLNKIKLDKKNLKPNFSFSLNSSSKKENQEKNVNLSVALISNRNNKEFDDNNETEEIKEDININPYDEKIKPEEEEQRIITNISQNISLNKKKNDDNINIDINENINENLNENIKDNINENIKEKITENITEKINENLNENITSNINENITENINDNIKEDINEDINKNAKQKENEELSDKNKRNLEENPEEKNRQNALNTLPFYDMEEESEKNINNKSKENKKTDNNNISNENNKNGNENSNENNINDNYYEEENVIEKEENEKINTAIDNKKNAENKEDLGQNNNEEDNYLKDENYDYQDEEINLENLKGDN